MKILLIGHEGYLGSRLIEYLGEREHDVVGYGRVDDINTVTRSFLEAIGIELVVNCATAANRVDSIYKLGGTDEEVNVSGVRQLILALRGTDIGLIHVSTKDVYGDVYSQPDVVETESRLTPVFTINERQPFRPKTIYAKTKLMGEFIAESHPKTAIIRLSSGYTSQPHRKGNWILHFCRTARAGQSARINGSGKQLRDPLHADDLGNLILMIHERSAWGHTLNAGGGVAGSYSIREVLDMIKPGSPCEFMEGGDLGYVSDIGLCKRILGWNPALNFSEELNKLMNRVANE